MTAFLSSGNLPQEYAQLASTVKDFADTVIAPVAGRHNADGSFPYEVVSGMADMGLFGLPFPEEYGGMGGDFFALCLALEELGKVDQSVAITLEAAVSLGAMPISASAARSSDGNGCRSWHPAARSARSG